MKDSTASTVKIYDVREKGFWERKEFNTSTTQAYENKWKCY